MDLFRSRRRTRGSVAPQGTELSAERTPRRSLKRPLVFSFHFTRTTTSSRRNAAVPASHPISYSTTIDFIQTSREKTEEAKLEVINRSCTGQADLKTEVQSLRKTVAEQDARLQYYQSEPYRNEVLSIRRHLRVAEEHEPWWISQRFTEITVKVDDISGELSELLLPLKPARRPTARSLFERLYFPHGEPQPSATHISRHSVRPDEYIDFGCRALINQFLMKTVFNDREFHPSLSPEENHVFYSRYQKIRAQDPQVIAGHWRVSTIKSLGEFHKNHAALAQRFCEEVMTPFCSNIYNLESLSQTLAPITLELSELLKLASEWRSFTNRLVVMYDFHPQFLDPGAELDTREVEIEGAKSNTPSSNMVLLTTRLGLFTSRTLGDSQDIDRAIQSKIGVLTSEYFAVET